MSDAKIADITTAKMKGVAQWAFIRLLAIGSVLMEKWNNKMKKYIDYDNLEQEAYEMVCHARQQVDLVIANTIKSMIDGQPDALIRCKDCKYCGSEIKYGIKFAKCELKHNWMPQPDWFCADGERRQV